MQDATDQLLDDVTLKQIAFKPGLMQAVAVTIVSQFLPDRIIWLDEVELPPGLEKKDMNCVSATWRRLCKLGILKRMEGAENYRRSAKKSRRGGTVFKYRVLNEKLAETFLKRNGWTRTRRGQPELQLE